MLDVVVRRFRCENLSCPRKIFAERFGDDALAPRARRTGRLDFLARHLGLVLGGRPAARFARRLSITVSNDTLIRAVRRGHATRNSVNIFEASRQPVFKRALNDLVMYSGPIQNI